MTFPMFLAGGTHRRPKVTTGLPDPLNAGVTPGASLSTVSGDVSLTSSQTYTNKHITGGLFIAAAGLTDVTVKDCLIDGSVHINRTTGGSYFTPVPNRITLKNCQFTDIESIGFDNLTIDSCNVVGAQDSAMAQLFNYSDGGGTYSTSNLILQHSWFHGAVASAPGSTAHMECLHLGGCDTAYIYNNRFELYSPDGSNTLDHFTACVTLEPKFVGVMNRGVRIDRCSFWGGSFYQLYYDADGTGNAVTNCQFHSDSPIFTAAQYPIASYTSGELPGDGYHRFTASGNTLDGSPVTLDGQA